MDNVKKQMLKNHGLKYSKNRILILEILSKAEIPLSAEQIYDLCRQKGSSINLSTVYRILKAFVDAKLSLRSVIDMEDKSLYELNRHEHKHYLVCLGCHETVPISSCPLDKYQKELEKDLNYDITSHRLEMYGYCEECQETKN